MGFQIDAWSVLQIVTQMGMTPRENQPITGWARSIKLNTRRRMRNIKGHVALSKGEALTVRVGYVTYGLGN